MLANWSAENQNENRCHCIWLSKRSKYVWMFEHLSRPHGIELVQHLESAEHKRYWTLRVTADLEAFIMKFVIDWGQIWISIWGISAGRTLLLSRYSILLEWCNWLSCRSGNIVGITSHSCVHLGHVCRITFTTILQLIEKTVFGIQRRDTGTDKEC